MKHYVITLGAAATSLLAALDMTKAEDQGPHKIIFQPGPANANPVFLGFGPAPVTASATDYGVRLPAPTGAVPPPPFVLDTGARQGTLRLSSIHLFGTNTEKLHVTVFI